MTSQLHCDEPLAGEDLTYVLYGSGGYSLYDTARRRLLGGLDSTYEPAYVEDLDVGYRAITPLTSWLPFSSPII